jgi:uncharacterized protein YjbJ (UPF0337 family)
MNRHEFEANWSLLRAKIPEKWEKISQEDLNRIDGKFEPFLGYLRNKYGYSREQVDMEMKNWHLSSYPKNTKIESIASCDTACTEKKEGHAQGHHHAPRPHKEKKRKAS